MAPTVRYSQEVVSARLYVLILSSPRLRQALLPEGLAVSPYEVLTYQSTLTIHDRGGLRATFARTQHIRFQQQGVSALLDHYWGDGVKLTDYGNDAGVLGDSFRDAGRSHLVIKLKRAMAQGEELRFSVSRTAMAAFTEDDEWLETTIDHPVQMLTNTVRFPKTRPCQRAWLRVGEQDTPLTIHRLLSGRTLVRIVRPQAQAHTPYRIRWLW